MQLDCYILMGLILLIGSALQGAIGFGFGLFAVPLLILVGMEPYIAIATVGTCALTQAGVGVYRHHRDISWKQVAWMAAIAVAIQPIGVYFLKQISDLHNDRVRQIFGVIMLAVVAAHMLIRPKPRQQLHPAWAVVAMVCSGILSGMAGMSGPPIVLWVIAHNWSSTKMRATLWAFFVPLTFTNLVFQSMVFEGVWEAAGVALLFVPVMLFGTLPGMWLGKRLPRKLLRNLSVTMLVLIGLYALLEPILFPSLR